MQNNKIYLTASLVLILLLSVFLGFAFLTNEGYGNLYYASTVKSMLTGMKIFLFTSFDSAGFVTVDKPPVGLWVQALFAKILGFTGIALLLPQAIAAVLSVYFLYSIIRNLFDERAGLMAAFVLAITPAFVALSRNNTMDMQLLFVMVLASWAFFKSIEKKSFSYLLSGFALIGLGFNIKMMLSFIVLPAMGIIWLINREINFKKKFMQIVVASALLFAIAFSWIFIMELIPKQSRPYIGSTKNNSALELVIGHNGALRIKPQMGNGKENGKEKYDKDSFIPSFYTFGPGGPPVLVFESGKPGILRLFNKELAGQVSWFLPLILVGFFLFIKKVEFKSLFSKKKTLGILYWLIWFLPYALFLSLTSGIFHRHYVLMLTVPIAALCGIFSVRLWDAYKGSGFKSFLLPAAVFLTGVFQFYIVKFHGELPGGIGYFIIFIFSFLTVLLILKKLSIAFITKLPDNVIVITVIVILSVMPFYWSCTPLIYGGNLGLPYASPDLKNDSFKGKYVYSRKKDENIPGVKKLYDYLMENNTGEKFIAAVPTPYALGTSLILYQKNKDKPVMAMGGFAGADTILTLDELKAYIKKGDVRFFFVPVILGAPKKKDNTELYYWLKNEGKMIDKEKWFEPFLKIMVTDDLELYDLKNYREKPGYNL